MIRNPGHTIALIVLAFAIYLIVAGAVALGHGLVHREPAASPWSAGSCSSGSAR